MSPHPAGGAAADHDVLIVGAGPAGLAAAVRLRALDARVLVVDKLALPRRRALPAWLGPAGVALCGECGLTDAAVGARAFAGLRLHPWELGDSVRAEGDELRGWIVDRQRVDAALVTRAREAGAEVRDRTTVRALRLGEQSVTAELEPGGTVTAGIALLAGGTAELVGTPGRTTSWAAGEAGVCCAQVVVPDASDEAGLDVVLGGRAAPLAAIVRSPDAVRVTLVGREDEAALRAALPELWAAAATAGLVPAVPGGLPEPTIVRAGAALDYDTHAGKRLLLIGEAGGFAAGFSAETVYPAMLSGWIAAEVAGRALAAERAQEALAEFGLEWRARLADYLRSPNADLSLLLPLVFRNEQIARRVARAFLLGVEF